MASPPAYHDVVSNGWHIAQEEKTSSDKLPRWNIQEVVTSSRAQHVASVVDQMLPQIKTRAQHGYSKTELILIPSDEEKAREGQLVGLEQDKPPVIIQFEGDQNATSFWSQPTVVLEMKRQLLAELITKEGPDVATPVQPSITRSTSSRTKAWFRRRAKDPEVQSVEMPSKQQPVSVESLSMDSLRLDELK